MRGTARERALDLRGKATHAEIAAEIGISRNTVGGYYFRADHAVEMADYKREQRRRGNARREQLVREFRAARVRVI